MYSPKIRKELIPRVYQAALEANLPMTTWVNQAVEKSLPPTAQQTQPANHRKDTCHEHN